MKKLNKEGLVTMLTALAKLEKPIEDQMFSNKRRTYFQFEIVDEVITTEACEYYYPASFLFASMDDANKFRRQFAPEDLMAFVTMSAADYLAILQEPSEPPSTSDATSIENSDVIYLKGSQVDYGSLNYCDSEESAKTYVAKVFAVLNDWSINAPEFNEPAPPPNVVTKTEPTFVTLAFGNKLEIRFTVTPSTENETISVVLTVLKQDSSFHKSDHNDPPLRFYTTNNLCVLSNERPCMYPDALAPLIYLQGSVTNSSDSEPYAFKNKKEFDEYIKVVTEGLTEWEKNAPQFKRPAPEEEEEVIERPSVSLIDIVRETIGFKTYFAMNKEEFELFKEKITFLTEDAI